MSIITRGHAQRLILAGKAIANGYTLDAARNVESITVDRPDLCRVDHYPYTDADADLVKRIDRAFDLSAGHDSAHA